MAKNSQAVIPDNIIVVEGDGLNPVPTPEAGDAGKVLGVLNSSGDIGWVEDQGGTLTQVQSDWAETDSSKVSYIDNKPDLSVYATTSAMNTALAGKQDTISDLSDIRSGAAAGATAVQPSALESYATTSAMNTALAGKQDVINDLATIRSGAALGATAAQPSDLPSSDELVPSASSGDAGKVLTVDSNGDPSWQTSASVTVDQTYNASSTNPQSGTAVAQAIAAIPSSSYTAGDGIDISGNTISADFTEVQSALDFGSDFTFENPTQYTSTTANSSYWVVIPTDVATKFTLPGTLGNWPSSDSSVTVQLQVGSGSTWTTLKSGNYSTLASIPSDFYTDVDIPAGMNGKYIRWFCTYTYWYQTQNVELYIYNFDTTAKCFTVPGTGTLALANPVTVDQTYNASSPNPQSGVAVAQAIASIPSSSYTAGDGIDIDNGEISAKLDDDTLDLIQKTVETTYTGTTSTATGVASVPAAVASAFMSQTPVSIKVHIPVDTFSISRDRVTASCTVNLFVRDNSSHMYISDVAVSTTDSGKRIYVDEQDIVVSSPASSWAYASGTVTNVTGVGFEVVENGEYFIASLTPEFNNRIVTYTVTQVDQTQKSIAVKNPLPASAQADSGKVLKVNASGNAEWGTDGFTTTAGITDIQVVNALPASPVATVLYLIPET